MIPILYFLGLCHGYAGDYQTSTMLCEMEYEAQYRAVPHIKTWSEEKRAWFVEEVPKVRWPHKGK